MEKHVTSVNIFSLSLTECLQHVSVHLKSKSQTPNRHNRTGPQKTEAKTRPSPPAVGLPGSQNESGSPSQWAFTRAPSRRVCCCVDGRVTLGNQ